VKLDPTNLDPDVESTTVDAPDEWVLQADAADTAGCSVSAIRKWRREGTISDRRTMTSGGLERVEVRLQDVLNRCGREPHRADTRRAPVASIAEAGTLSIPLADLQALILNLAAAERGAHEATDRLTVMEIETLRLTDALTRAEAQVATARSDVEALRNRVRDLEVVTVDEWPGPVVGRSETDRLREELASLKARMAESRIEVDGQRRRIRELEARPAAPSEREMAAESENERLRDRLRLLEARLSTAEKELAEGMRIREMEARSAQPPESAFLEKSEDDGVRNDLRRVEDRLAAAKREMDGQRRRIRELESLLDRPGATSGTVAEALPHPRPRQVPTPPRQASATNAGGERPRRPAEPRSAGLQVDSPAVTGVKMVAQRWKQRRPAGAESSPQPEPEFGPTATHLRRLYHRLQTRRVGAASAPDENRRWVADLTAYDDALIAACHEFGVPTRHTRGDRLPAEERVALTRALGAAGLDVRKPIAS